MEDMVFDTAELQTYLSEYERSGAIEFLKEQYIGDKGIRYNSVWRISDCGVGYWAKTYIREEYGVVDNRV